MAETLIEAFQAAEELLMPAAMFNTLKYAKVLEEVGFSRDQAETSVRILLEVMEDKLFTKEDGRNLESRLTIRFGTMLATLLTLAVAVLAIVLKV